MRNIIGLFAAMLFLVSCKKNTNSELSNNDNVQQVAGTWDAAYLGRTLQVTIDSPGHFSLVVPVIVKKESAAAPVTWEITCKGLCTGQNGSYRLRTDALTIAGQEAGAGADAKTLLEQSLSGIDITVQQTGVAGEHRSARLSSQNGELWLSRP